MMLSEEARQYEAKHPIQAVLAVGTFSIGHGTYRVSCPAVRVIRKGTGVRIEPDRPTDMGWFGFVEPGQILPVEHLGPVPQDPRTCGIGSFEEIKLD